MGVSLFSHRFPGVRFFILVAKYIIPTVVNFRQIALLLRSFLKICIRCSFAPDPMNCATHDGSFWCYGCISVGRVARKRILLGVCVSKFIGVWDRATREHIASKLHPSPWMMHSRIRKRRLVSVPSIWRCYGYGGVLFRRPKFRIIYDR